MCEWAGRSFECALPLSAAACSSDCLLPALTCSPPASAAPAPCREDMRDELFIHTKDNNSTKLRCLGMSQADK